MKQVEYNGKIYSILKNFRKFVGETEYLLQDIEGKKI